jgi:hypothetical protein
MAFGAGSEVGHRAIGAMFGGSSAPRHEHAPAPAAAAAAPAQVRPPTNHPPTTRSHPPIFDTTHAFSYRVFKASGPCAHDHLALNQCLQSANAASCDFYFQALQNCQTNSQ